MKHEFLEHLPEKNICLLGLQGSRGQGLMVEHDADYDYRGIFVETNDNLLSLFPHRETLEYIDSRDGQLDFVLHEVKKFFQLGLKSNPSVIHLLFLPEYNYIDDIGKMILANRNLFLGTTSIRRAFAGYAQNRTLEIKRKDMPERKIKKNIRLTFRILDEGIELLSTGNITIPCPQPDYYFEIEKLNEKDWLQLYYQKTDQLQHCKSILPENPDTELTNKLLLKIREMNN